MSDERHRPVRSYVRREGRLTSAQHRALQTLWPRFGLEVAEHKLDLDELFGRRAKRTLEIGFGNGAELVRRAAGYPEQDFLGIEVHRPGVGRLLLQLEEQGVDNVRVICHDAVEVLERQLPPACVDVVLLLFPDPWPKKRHHKRRIVQPPFAALLATILRPGGVFHVATDWGPYAEHIEQVMASHDAFVQVAAPEAGARGATRFEQRGRGLGHDISELSYRKLPRSKS